MYMMWKLKGTACEQQRKLQRREAGSMYNQRKQVTFLRINDLCQTDPRLINKHNVQNNTNGAQWHTNPCSIVVYPYWGMKLFFSHKILSKLQTKLVYSKLLLKKNKPLTIGLTFLPLITEVHTVFYDIRQRLRLFLYQIRVKI